MPAIQRYRSYRMQEKSPFVTNHLDEYRKKKLIAERFSQNSLNTMLRKLFFKKIHFKIMKSTHNLAAISIIA